MLSVRPGGAKTPRKLETGNYLVYPWGGGLPLGVALHLALSEKDIQQYENTKKIQNAEIHKFIQIQKLKTILI